MAITKPTTLPCRYWSNHGTSPRIQRRTESVHLGPPTGSASNGSQGAPQSNPTPVQRDIERNLQSAVDRITTEVGYVNLVIANSGSIGPPACYNPAASLSEPRQTLFTNFSMDEMNYTLHLNITAAFFTMTAFLGLLDAGTRNALQGVFGKPVREGSDVPSTQSQVSFTTSISAFSQHYSSLPPYLASKVAIMQVAKQASTQLTRSGIRVNVIAPGSIFTVYPSNLASVLTQDRNPEEETFRQPEVYPR
ncbi:hypothetical protein BDV38DRAFT_288695 [Aspergillus pseudotamarii]|uniref:NAD(P)-binding protein n=1 Tax=Aspergillus pseudotamarii TaxID=132259 RepID=A0A5N6SC66_ASPPS|nr:uncharacterized protein BDV38DRAFT_288695 [Aspergillus pseudotamarii]KAE8131449.1 hypothetical protein BDV38DRAFT_288695 [Aspergillus pseudotamarii]